MKNEQIKNIYNKKIIDDYNFEYEKSRWFKNPIRQAGYNMTLKIIERHVLSEDFSYCLELGPGQGTWTDIIIKSKPNIKMDLVDISKEMLGLVKNRFKENNNLNFFEKDFLDFASQNKYDFFFSSRAIEYIDDKEKAVEKIVSLLSAGGRGFLITKMPKYLRNKLLGKKVADFHKGQIEPNMLVKLLNKYGVKDTITYPAAMSFPVLKSAKINQFLFDIFSKKHLNFISIFFAESYCIKFKKNDY